MTETKKCPICKRQIVTDAVMESDILADCEFCSTIRRYES